MRMNTIEINKSIKSERKTYDFGNKIINNLHEVANHLTVHREIGSH